MTKAAQLGDAGAAWRSGLPDLIDYLEGRWSITIGEPLNGGTASYVARTPAADPSEAVVKVSVPDLAFARQRQTLAVARGQGYVRFLAQAPGHYGVLLEALGSPLNHLALASEVQIDTLCDILPAAWQVSAPTGTNAEPALNKARSLAEPVAGLGRIWDTPARSGSPSTPFSTQSVARPRSTRTVTSSSMVTRHPPNPSRCWHPRTGAQSGFVFVDPDGFLGDPTYASASSCATGARCARR